VAKKQPAEDTASGKPKKRQLRPATTVREQSQKATARAEKPKKGAKVGRILSAPFRLLAKPFKILGKIKFFRTLGLILWPKYFRNSFRELRQVTWPNRKQTRQLTTAVIIFSVIFGVLIAIVDFGLDKLFKKVILQQ
jgi:preprotein translocase subunit SecE